MAPVLSALSTHLQAVPAFRRVDPVSPSGPVSRRMVTSGERVVPGQKLLHLGNEELHGELEQLDGQLREVAYRMRKSYGENLSHKGIYAEQLETLRAERNELRDNNVRLQVVGRIEDLPDPVRRVLDETQEFLSSSDGLLLNLALSYSGRAEIVDAVRRMIEVGIPQNNGTPAVDEALVEKHLYTAGMPDPDLLIRTSGEMRLSNFMLWQLAYTEMWITDTLWPDFRREHLFEAVAAYQGRDRRFGRVD